MRKKLFLIVIFLVVAVLVGIGCSMDYDRILNQWGGVSVRELKFKGNECLERDKTDSALIFYTMAATDLYRKAFYASVEVKCWPILFTTLGNLIFTAMGNGDGAGVLPEIRKFWKLRIPQMEMLDYTRSLCRTTEAACRHDDSAAISWIERAISQVDTQFTPERYIWGAAIIKAYIYVGRNDYAKAIGVMDTIERQTRHEAMHWNMLGLQLSDSLFRNQQYGLIRDMKSTYEIKKIDTRMQEVENRRQTVLTALVIVVISAVVFLVMAVLIYRKNRRLSDSNRDLFRRNEEMMRLERNERHRREVYECRIRQCEEELKSLRADVKTPLEPAAATETSSEKAVFAPHANARHTVPSQDEYARQQLLDRINRVLEQVEVISANDFSVDRLAKLVDSNSKYVSQAINEAYGKSFSTLLGERRVKQACLRLCDTATYGNLTIEAIATGLGFKSRSNFVTVFKRVTGLTPSDYKKISMSDNADNR